jgi:hypothetical protein
MSLSKKEKERLVRKVLSRYFTFSEALYSLPVREQQELIDLMDARGVYIDDLPKAFADWLEGGRV